LLSWFYLFYWFVFPYFYSAKVHNISQLTKLFLGKMKNNFIFSYVKKHIKTNQQQQTATEAGRSYCQTATEAGRLGV